MALSSCSFYKWRCLIALAYVDVKLAPEERQFLSDELKLLQNEGISKEQLAQLGEDRKNPMQPEVLFVRIDDPVEMIDLLRMAYFLFLSDNHYETRERDVFEDLRGKISRRLDIAEDKLDAIAQFESPRLSISIKPIIEDFLRKEGKL